MKRHTLWLIEFFIWLFVISFTILGIRYYNAKQIGKNATYHIFLQDIDGLMKGSPIKIMGVQIGYVTEVNIIDDYMYVSFMISKDDVKIPRGARALIESYGIAGSKSIELYPPKEKISETSPIIFVEKPIRASDAFITQNEIAKTLITVSNGATAMLDTQSAKQHQQYIQKITILSGSIDLNKIDEKSDEIIKKLQKRKGIKNE